MTEPPDGAPPGQEPLSPHELAVTVAVALAACVALVFGFEAFVVAPDPPTKVLGALLALFSIGAIAPIFFGKSPNRDFARFWGSLSGAAAATLALYEQYTIGDHTLWVAGWWALLALSVIGVIVVRSPKVGSHAFWVSVAAVATSSTVVGLAQYWWRTFYEPLRVVPELTASVKLKPLAGTGHVVPVDLTITIKNPTTVDIQPLVSLFTVSGLAPARGRLGAATFRRQVGVALAGAAQTSAVDRYVAFRRALVAAGPVVPTDEVIPAKGSITVHLLVELPSARPRFMVAAARVQIAFVQSERLSLVPVAHAVTCRADHAARLDTAAVCADFANADRKYTSAVVSEWQIPRHTWFAQATMDPRYVLAAVVQARAQGRYDRGTYFAPDTPYVFATANARSKNADRADPGRLGKYYFVSLVSTTAIVPVPVKSTTTAH